MGDDNIEAGVENLTIKVKPAIFCQYSDFFPGILPSVAVLGDGASGSAGSLLHLAADQIVAVKCPTESCISQGNS